MKYVFIDMDGVIAEYGYPNGYYDGDFQKGNYLNKRPIVSIINNILKRYGGNPNYILMICSAVPNTKASIEKDEWLSKYFNVPYENRIFVSQDEDKVEIIRFYIEDIRCGNVQSHAVIIDDKGSVLAKAKSLGIECYHPTQILAEDEMVSQGTRPSEKEEIEQEEQEVKQEEDNLESECNIENKED